MRFVLILVAVAVVGLATWSRVNESAFEDVLSYESDQFDYAVYSTIYSPFPFIVANDGIGPDDNQFGDETKRRYYAWCFGYVIQLPYTRHLRDQEPL